MRMSGPEEILLDLNKLAEGHSFLSLGAFNVSDDGTLLAYTTDITGYRQFTLHVKDLRTGQVLKENVERTGSVVWATDNKTLFYTTEDAVSKRSDKFYRHAVGSEVNDLLYEEKDELFDVFATRSLDKKIIFLMSFAKTSREAHYLPADNPTAELKTVLPREAGHVLVDVECRRNIAGVDRAKVATQAQAGRNLGKFEKRDQIEARPGQVGLRRRCDNASVCRRSDGG